MIAFGSTLEASLSFFLSPKSPWFLGPTIGIATGVSDGANSKVGQVMARGIGLRFGYAGVLPPRPSGLDLLNEP